MRWPGPIFSWPPLFTSLGRELHETLDPSTVLVFENLEVLAAGDETLRLLSSHILQSLPNQAPCILISNQRLPSSAISEHAQRFDAKELRLDNLASLSLAERISTSLPEKQIQQVALLSEGRPEVLVGLCMACNCLKSTLWNGQTRSVDELLQTITRALIAQVDSQAQQALGLLVNLGYSHPSLIGKSLEGHLSADAPWFQLLTEDWERFRRLWRPLLLHNLSPSRLQNDALVNHLGRRLIAQGALPQAVRLYRWAGDTNSIAQEVCKQANNLLDLGQWDTLRGWIDQLPPADLESCPALLLYRGQISAAQGDFAGSSKNFSKAATLSSAREDFTTACQSMLADCVVASRLGRYDAPGDWDELPHGDKHGLTATGAAPGRSGPLDILVNRRQRLISNRQGTGSKTSPGETIDGAEDRRRTTKAFLLEFHTEAIQEAEARRREIPPCFMLTLTAAKSCSEQHGWSGVPAR
jgi:tetratricopeptide (TPR) repeat protein